MQIMENLESLLRAAFNIEHNQIGINSVYSKGDIYEHVILELNVFTLSDREIKMMFDCANKTGYSFYFTPRGERETDARHYICFHK